MKQKRHQQRPVIFLAGSGSGGPVTPLLALVPFLHRALPVVQCVLVGSGGVEERLAKGADVPYVQIVAAKLRRYWSWTNVLAPFQCVIGFVQSYFLLGKEHVACVVGAGGFVQVPLVWAAWLRGVPIVIHQQDVIPGLANRLCAPFADKITVSLERSQNDFPAGWMLRHLNKREGDRVVWTGNPVRDLEVPSRVKAHQQLRIDSKFPTILIMGGGTGSRALNDIVLQALPLLERFANVIHLTGGREVIAYQEGPHYRRFAFLDDMGCAYGAADVVVSRAGMGAITELAHIGKPAIIIPMPNSHQEYNADVLNEKEAALAVTQEVLTAEGLSGLIRGLLFEHRLQQRLVKNLQAVLPVHATKSVATIIVRLIQSSAGNIGALAGQGRYK
ncbi:MAG: UDP-N-acetylglucosamine--N-acetylmuramyl-(pentapeptide) pyrophosphoryl-undecaprenol N-acetylglucosamine transferase [Candidatus Doudnabacteria bacterium]|nr:UDP-N-acetylglucosamine--N-acetylmuramyl-(pentapeptide) pyrophosphoryl-undecaprenol N-acetylglucosamine transferase [Candidatus Doudnabacteria bacterium]